MFICCPNKNNTKTGKEIISITPLELVEKFNLNEQQTIDYYKLFRIQITEVITEINRPMRDREDAFGNIIDYQEVSIIVFGDVYECGWEVFFYIDGIVDRDIHIGDTITIQGSLKTVERHKALIAESVHVPMDETEIQYLDVIYIDITNCIIISHTQSQGEVERNRVTRMKTTRRMSWSWNWARSVKK
jgi:hypothetical protein